MKTVTKIVAATDFSMHADKAAHRAALVADEVGAALELLHVVDPAGFMAVRDWLGPSVDLGAAALAQARDGLQRFAEQFTAGGKPASASVRVGNPLQEVQAAAQAADLLVLGARGSHPMRDFILGTTADRLLRKSTGPLLVVRASSARPYRRVLTPVDFSDPSRAAVEAALAVAPKASVLLFHVFDLGYEGKLQLAGVSEAELFQYRARARQDSLDRLHELAASLGPVGGRVSIEVAHGDVALLLAGKAEQMGADLVAVGKHGRSLVEDVLLGSVTRHMLADAPCDVLVVPGPAIDA